MQRDGGRSVEIVASRRRKNAAALTVYLLFGGAARRFGGRYTLPRVRAEGNFESSFGGGWPSIQRRGPFHPRREVTRTLNGVPFSIRCSGLSPAFEPVRNSASVVARGAEGERRLLASWARLAGMMDDGFKGGIDLQGIEASLSRWNF